jgi:hypothetical protein
MLVLDDGPETDQVRFMLDYEAAVVEPRIDMFVDP